MLEPPRRTCRRLGRLLKKGRHGAPIANFSNATLSPDHDTHAKTCPSGRRNRFARADGFELTKRNCAYNPRLLIVPVILPEQKIHVYEVRPRKDKRGVDLISDALAFGRLWYAGPDAVNDAKFLSHPHNAVIRIYDAVSNMIEAHEHVGDFKEW